MLLCRRPADSSFSSIVDEPFRLSRSCGTAGTSRTAGARVRTLSRRVEDVVEPPLRLLEALVLAQAVGDQQRRVEEELPVVDGVGAAVEVDVLDRVVVRVDFACRCVEFIEDRAGVSGSRIVRQTLSIEREKRRDPAGVERLDERADVWVRGQAGREGRPLTRRGSVTGTS